MKKNRRIYVAPTIEVIEVKVEKGFAGSGFGAGGENEIDPWGGFYSAGEATKGEVWGDKPAQKDPELW